MRKDTAPSEKELEDFLFAYANYVAYGGDRDLYPPVTVLRQVRLKTGIADLLLCTVQSILVLEVKRGVLDTKALAQVLRYTHELRAMATEALAEFTLASEVERWMPHLITPALMGLAIETDVLVAADAAGVRVKLYHYNAEQNTYGMYSPLNTKPIYQHQSLKNYSDLSQALRNAFDYLNWQEDQEWARQYEEQADQQS